MRPESFAGIVLICWNCLDCTSAATSSIKKTAEMIKTSAFFRNESICEVSRDRNVKNGVLKQVLLLNFLFLMFK